MTNDFTALNMAEVIARAMANEPELVSDWRICSDEIIVLHVRTRTNQKFSIEVSEK